MLNRTQRGEKRPATFASDWVRREYETLERQAQDRKSFRFVPIRLDAAKLPAFAQNRVFLDFAHNPDGPNGGELLRLLHSVVGLPLSDEAARFAAEQDVLAKKLANEIGAAIRNKDASMLLELEGKAGLPWETSAALGCKAAEGLIKLGKNTEAIAMLVRLESKFAMAIRTQQLHALALARRAGEGDLRTAQGILGALYENGERDPETLGIYGRTWMDRYVASNDVADLLQSRDLYAEAFEAATDDYYTGINAAAKSVLLGSAEDLERAKVYAERVQVIVGTEPHPNDYWKTATVAEAFLLARKYAEAAGTYKAAVAMAKAEKASQETTWKQACRLMAKLGPSAEERALVREAFTYLPDCDAMLSG